MPAEKFTNSIIAAIGISTAQYSFEQNNILEFMHHAYSDQTISRKLNILFKQSGINKRHSVVPDFDPNFIKPELFNGNGIPNLDQRLNKYKLNALPLAVQAVDNAINCIGDKAFIKQITHIITVSCTGMYAPGLSIELINYYNLPENTFHTAINFMGCNASFAALRMADLIIKADDDAKVLIVCVELCTLHFQPKNNNDNLIANTLFGDGAAAMIITSGEFRSDLKTGYIEIKGFHTLTLKEGNDLMAWNINPINFEMILSADVPGFIGANAKETVNKIIDHFKMESLDNIIWAIHPGGKKILDAFYSNLLIDKDELKASYKVLEQNGNMSSVTIIFVLKELLDSLTKTSQIIAMGFGPGISIESALLKYVQ